MQVKSFKDMGKAKYQLKSIGNNLPEDFLDNIRRNVVANILLDDINKDISEITKATDIKDYISKKIDDIKERTEALQEQAENLGVTTYTVRGLTPKEKAFTFNLMPFDKTPSPPKKKKEILTLDNRRNISPEAIENSFEYDENDPTYKQELIIYSKLVSDAGLIIATFKLMCAVEGFDLTDDEIKEELGEEAKASKDRTQYLNGTKDIKEYIERIHQVEKIILGSIDSAHLDFLISAIDELTGVKADNINFM